MEFIEIKNLNNSELEALYIDSFPKEERIDFKDMFSGVFKPFKLYLCRLREKMVFFHSFTWSCPVVPTFSKEIFFLIVYSCLNCDRLMTIYAWVYFWAACSVC